MGYTNHRGTRAIQGMNRLHGRFPIANEDFLYVLSTFLFEPIRWNTHYGWRTMCEQAHFGLFYLWRAVGHRLHIQEIPEDYQTVERFNLEYERDFPVYASKLSCRYDYNEFVRQMVTRDTRSTDPPGHRCHAGTSAYRRIRISPTFPVYARVLCPPS